MAKKGEDQNEGGKKGQSDRECGGGDDYGGIAAVIKEQEVGLCSEKGCIHLHSRPLKSATVQSGYLMEDDRTFVPKRIFSY